jgi:iduronate 2-sulfatase
VRPNVLFIAIDDLNSWIGCMGTNPDVKTPNIDRLASQGMLFANAVCPSPVCTPSRTSILTGLRPSTTGCYQVVDKLAGSPANGRAIPLPLLFRRGGYQTMSGGKVDHTNSVEAATKERLGESMWDELGGQMGGQHFDMYSRHVDACLREAGGTIAFATHWGPLDDDQVAELSDLKIADWAVERLQRSYDEPFFLAAGFHKPHTPLIAPRECFDLYDPNRLHLPPNGPYDFDGMPSAAQQVALTGFQELARGNHYQVVDHGFEREIVQAYLACISFTDANVGKVLRALEASEHAENTIVVLWSDNGWSLGEHFHWKKWTLWDQGSRVPFIVKAPGVTTAGSRCEEGVTLTDIYPTLLELCGLPAQPECEAESLVGLLSGEQTSRERPGLTIFGPGNYSLRTSRWRYTVYDDGSEELYDYDVDPDEHTNLADRPEDAALKTELASWLPESSVPGVDSSPPLDGRIEVEPGDRVNFQAVHDGFANRSITVEARVESHDGDGVIVHHAGCFAGYALYLREGRLGFAVMDVPQPLRWDTLEPRRTAIVSGEPVPEGSFDAWARLETDGAMSIAVDGRIVATGTAPGPLSIYPAGLLEAGCYRENRYPAVGDYGPSEEFPGALSGVRVLFGEER